MKPLWQLAWVPWKNKLAFWTATSHGLADLREFEADLRRRNLTWHDVQNVGRLVAERDRLRRTA